MRAIVMEEAGGPLAVREVDDPLPPRGGVTIRVKATGLCRSDWHAWMGHFDIPVPHILGHEFAGTIAAIGAGVTKWHVGQRVTVPFVEACGECEWCLAGDGQVCPEQRQPGFSHSGSFAELVAVHAADVNLVSLPDDLSFAAAASLGCRFATAYRGLTARAAVQPGEWVTIVGSGGVGLSAVVITKLLGAKALVVDRNPSALEAASSLGADATILSHTEGLLERIYETTDGGSHVAVDAVGSEDAVSTAVHSLRRRGRHVQIGLLPPTSGHPRVPMERVIGWELDMLGSHGMPAVDYPGMLALIRSSGLRLEDLIGDVVGFAEAAAAIPLIGTEQRTGMTVLDVSRD